MVLMGSAQAEARSDCGRRFVELCAWAATTSLAAVPAQARQRASLVLSDDIAAMVAAATEPEVVAIQAELVRGSGAPAATLLARTAVRVDRHTAAAGNGLAISWSELDEGYRLVACHAGAYIIPALIAEAEATGARTADVIASLAIAYEVTARIAHAFPSEPLRVHPHGAFAPLGAAAGVARLRGYSAKDLAAALSSAMSMSHAGPYSHAPAGALARNAWTATGAWAGYRAADWAPLGIGGLPETIFDVMATCYGHDCLPDRLSAGLGSSWAINSGYHKMIACCQYAHSAVEATLRLRAELPALKDAANIAAIVVATHPMGETLATAEPETVLAGKFSMLHAVATTAVHGSGGARAFTRASLSDPQVAALRSRIRLVPHEDLKPWPKDRPARVEVTLTDGSRRAVSIDSARGGPDDPFSEAELRDKIAALTGELYPAMARGLSGLATSPNRWADDLAAMVVQAG
ncbi:MAG TPA: MmgE/PrpD family protein [Hyphomicrobiaceae bacterium]|nr:MmgE/PrpD family protein [Hyphomicrobiaceae bacterium]